jgi:hypothetical protein
MTLDFAMRHWSLIAASILLTAIALFVALRAFTDSASGQLRTRAHNLDKRYRQAARAGKAADTAEARLKKLREKASTVKPRLLQEASEAFQDARALKKIADDQVLVAENHVRKIIVEEFRPARQEALRRKYLRRSEDHSLPFTF